MHVAMAFLFWLGIRKVSRVAGWFFFAFLIAIWIGSVHLAYHYAVDGLVSVIATAIIWKASGAIAARLGSGGRPVAGSGARDGDRLIASDAVREALVDRAGFEPAYACAGRFTVCCL